MINKIMASNNSPSFGHSGAVAGKVKRSLSTKFIESKRTAKVLKSDGFFNAMKAAGGNPTVWQSGCAFAICVGPRPATNYVVTEDKKDATYANSHSISSGTIGLIWPIIFATPIAVGMSRINKNPMKYLKPEVIKRFHPDVATREVFEDGKKCLKIVTNEKGKMLREDGSELCMSLEPLMIYGKENQAKFNKTYPNFTVDKTGVVRIKPVKKADGGWEHIQTEKGVGKFKIVKGEEVPVGQPVQVRNFAVDAEGNLKHIKKDKSGAPLLDENENMVLEGIVEEKEFTPITEAMEIGSKKEDTASRTINMVPDILLAPVRASLTIALIPPILNAFGIRKSNKSNASGGINYVSTSNNSVLRAHRPGDIASSFSSLRKGGVQ